MVKLSNGAVLVALMASCASAEEMKTPQYKTFWGWCPSQDVNENIDKSVYKLDPNQQYECDDYIGQASEIAQDGKYQGEYIGYPGGACNFIKTQKSCEDNMNAFIVDFQEMYYCDFQSAFCQNGKTWFFLPVTIVFLVIAMYNLGSTADSYLSPALEAISEKLSCSESLAGVTLLALGNGAPDVFAAMSAGSGGDGGDITFTVSCLMGSAFFITSVVMYLSVNGAPTKEGDEVKKIRVTKRFFLRDLMFFGLTCIYLIVVIIFVGKITIAVTSGFLGLYGVFVITVVVQSKMKGADEEEEQKDREDAQKALQFTELVHQKRDAAASIANGLVQSKNPNSMDNTQLGSLNKALGLTKKMTMRMVEEEEPNSLKLPSNLTGRRASARKGQGQQNLDINNDQTMENSQNQNSIDYNEADTIKVTTEKIVKNEVEDVEPEFGATKPLITQGSVWIKQSTQGPSIQADHVDSILRQSQMNGDALLDQASADVQEQIDQLFAAQKIKMVFKRASFDGFFNKCWLIVELPLNILRDYTCPMSEFADWNRNRAMIIPLTFIWGFLYLQGFFNPELEDDDFPNEDAKDEAEQKEVNKWLMIAGYTMIPMLVLSIYIRFYTKVTQPPPTIMFLFAIISFVNSISWIGFTCDIVVDILTIMGQILNVPKAMLGFTLLAWGNCLGDMQANVAMTKKGFGEMAITGCMAGPIFNILMGLGLATIGGLLTDYEEKDHKDGDGIPFSLFIIDSDTKLVTNKINPKSVVPFGLMVALFLSLVIIGINAVVNDYHISKKLAQVNLIFYASVLVGLLSYTVYDIVNEEQ